MVRLPLLPFVLLLFALIASAADAPAAPQVFYLAGLTDLLEEEKCAAPGCEWRLYDPATGADRAFLPLPQFPRNVFWDEGFHWIYFRIRGSLFRAAWRWNAEPVELLKFPVETTPFTHEIEAVWLDADSQRWRMQTVEYAYNAAICGAWEYDPDAERWLLLDKRLAQSAPGGFVCEGVLDDLIHPAGDVLLLDLLERMRIDHHADGGRRIGHLRDDGQPEKLGDPIYEFPSATLPGVAIRVSASFGGTFHAVAPLTYFNSALGIEKVIYSTEEPCYDQIAFEERRGFLLAVAEYTGGCARVVDMRTGEVIRTVPSNAAAAVWVPPPAP